MTKRTALAIVSLGILAAPAMADETGFYVGANALSLLSTYRRADIDGAFSSALSEADSSFTMGPSSVERAHYSWQVNFGYMLTRNFGVEVSFLDLGKFRYSGFGTRASAADGSPSEVHLDLDVRSHGPALAAVGVLPMTNFWDLEARVGAMQAKTKSSFSTATSDGTNSGGFSGNSTVVMASVGTAFTVTTHIVLRLDYLRIQHIKEKALDRSFNVDGATAGVAYVF
jgi:opacity protein-like surface antigen